jgi:hypothetical protein
VQPSVVASRFVRCPSFASSSGDARFAAAVSLFSRSPRELLLSSW